MRKPFIAGNWKMNKTVREAVDAVLELKRRLAMVRDVEIAVAPPFTALTAVARKLQDSHIKVAGQDVFWEKAGAFTGEVSPSMLKDAGCTHCIVGHSERRQYFGDTDEKVNRKAKALLAEGIRPIVCVGEMLAEREAGRTFGVIDAQVRGCMAGLSAEDACAITIAYEPVWAIGTGRNATPVQAQEVHAHIRKILSELFGEKSAEQMRIQYGGSVKPDNIPILMAEPDIDGALVGGASLNPEEFAKIVRFKKEDQR